VQEFMRENRVLLSLNGQGRNCLKIRPPLVFDTSHADIALAALDDALGRVS
jgi:4-aminobutyrate aminotransferase-like enzyme